MRNCIIRLAHDIARSERTFLPTILGVYCFIATSHAIIVGKTVYGDGRYYVAILRSIAVDNDLSFANEYRLLGITERRTPHGDPVNKYQIGPALVWLPGYLTLRPLLGGTGLEWPYQLYLALTGVSVAWIGLLIVSQILLRTFSRPVSSVTTLLIAGATSLLFYGSVDTVNSHAITFLFGSAFLASISPAASSVSSGSLLGWSILTRPQEAIAALLLMSSRSIRYGISTLFIACLWYIIQWIAWHISYGSWIFNGYLSAGEGFHPAFWPMIDVLFHIESGLLSVTPGILLGIVGWCMPWPTSIRRFKAPSIALWITQYLTIAWWSTPLQGASYGGRMFVGSLPALSISMAVLIDAVMKRRYLGSTVGWFLAIGLTVLNGLRIVWFLISHP